MKKLVLLASLCLGATPALGLANNSLNSRNKIPGDGLPNYIELKENVDLIINNIIENSLEMQPGEIENNVRSSVAKVLQEIEDNEIKIEDIVKYLTSTNEQFKNEYEKNINSNNLEFDKNITKRSPLLKNEPNYKELLTTLKDKKFYLVGLNVAAALVGVGLYSGLTITLKTTIPWAAAATATAAGIGSLLEVVENKLPLLENGTATEKKLAVKDINFALIFASTNFASASMLYPIAATPTELINKLIDVISESI